MLLDNSLAHTIANAALEIKHLTKYPAHIWWFVYRHNDVMEHQWRKLSIQAYYHVTSISYKFFITLKPWSLFTLQQHKASIKISCLTKATHCVMEQTKSSKISKETRYLWNLTTYKRLAESIHSVDHQSGPVEFNHLHNILRRLQNIKRLSVFLSKYKLNVTHVCQALNKLQRLRSLRLYTSLTKEVNSAPTFLLSKLRFGSILLPMLEVEAPTTCATKFDYRWLEIGLDKCLARVWIQFAQLCQGLAHICVTSSNPLPQFELFLPPRLIGLKIYDCCQEITQMLQPQMLLKFLGLVHAVFDWSALTQRCPNIRHLILIGVDICGPIITGLPVTEFLLCAFCRNENYAELAVVRHMVTVPLLHLDFFRKQDGWLTYEVDDWISNAEFLVGTRIVYSPDNWTDRIRIQRFSKRILVLSLRRLKYEMNID